MDRRPVSGRLITAIWIRGLHPTLCVQNEKRLDLDRIDETMSRIKRLGTQTPITYAQDDTDDLHPTKPLPTRARTVNDFVLAGLPDFDAV